MARGHNVFWVVLLLLCSAPRAAQTGQWPSLFRGVVVADHASGVRVISVDPRSQAYRADLRPEDIIVRVREADVRSIDDFSMISASLKGRTDHAKIVVFRNGAPREVLLHLYSYRVLEAWEVEFIPEFDLRFGDPDAGRQHWMRMARGYLEVGQTEDALNAYLNALDNLPGDPAVGLSACELFFKIGREKLRGQSVAAAMAHLGSALAMAGHLFDYPLGDADLLRVKTQLQETVDALRALKQPPIS